MRTQLAVAMGMGVALGALGCGSDSTADTNGADASADVGHATPSVCTDDSLAGGCASGHCRLTAPHGSVPAGTSVLLLEEPLPATLAQDAVGNVLCQVTLPSGGPLRQELSLAIALDGPVDAASALFRYEPKGGLALVPTSSAQPQGVAGIVTQSGTFGVTKRSGGWTVDGYAGVDVDSTTDPASVIRNISSHGIDAAYWDGTRLYVGNGARLLVYNGLPATPGQAPDMVLGQADLNTTSSVASSSVFRNGVRGVWSDGKRLAVSTGNRVLIWSALPSASFAPADIALGQPDFSADTFNNGGISASSLFTASQIDSDGTRLAVCDVQNNRVLVWNSFPVTIGQPATSVIGQPSFTSSDIFGGAVSVYQTWGALFAGQGAIVSSVFGFSGLQHVSTTAAMNPAPDFSVTQGGSQVLPNRTYTVEGLARLTGGGLFLRDAYAGRIGVFRSAPSAGGSSYDYVLGQPDLSRQIFSPTNASASPDGLPYALSGTGSRLLIPDTGRLLIADAPSYNYEPASFVIGQAGFSTNGSVDYRGIGATTLAAAADVAVSGAKVAVADRGNNRVVLYDKADLPTKPASAKVVLGQADVKGFFANGDLKSPSASRLSGPGGVAMDATHLMVADTENHRVLIWSPLPTTSGAPASVVLGQSDFSGHRPNHGRGDTSPLDGFSDADKDGLFYPNGVATDGTRLVVADRLNHRVLVWNAIPKANDAPADAVIGQATFTANLSNRGSGPYSIQPNGFNLPTGVAITGTTLWVADTENNRVVRVSNAFAAPIADAWIGQPDGATVANPNYNPIGHPNVGLAATPTPTASTLLKPRGVVVAGGALFVSEQSSNRVHMFDASTFAHTGQLGQTSATGATANAGGIGAASLAEPAGVSADGTTLFVADTNNHRVLGYDITTLPASGAAALLVVGQPSFVSNGFNQASSASGSTSGKPHGLARFATDLYVADTSHHRVLVLTAPPKAGDAPTRVFGQPDANLILPNAGGGPSARTLQSPGGVFVDADHVVVADTGNHRVLVFGRVSPSADATLVLGQTGFDQIQPNAGGAPSLSTLRAPQGVFYDGTSLFVADTGNHRVLVWNTFPTSSGQPADLVLGQATGADVLSNRGTAGATADAMSSPSAIDAVQGAIFVADSGNNRVLRFATFPTASGAAATSVLGQPDLLSRGAASSATDKTRLSGPVALADDGANLYVVDRDLSRLVVFTLPSDGTGVAATLVLGGSGGLNAAGPSGIAVEPTPFFTSRVYLADTNDDRLILLGSVSRLVGQ